MTQQRPIYRFISKIVCSVALLGIATVASAQSKGALTEADTVPLFRGIAVSVDMVGPVQAMTGDYGQYEGHLRVNLRDRYFPVFELGYGKANADDATTNITYKTSAPYGRIGCDFNILKNKHDIYRAYAGFRYGYTSFKYDFFSPGMTDPVWGGRADYCAKDISAYYHWLEGVFTIDAKVWRCIRLGWSARYKRRVAHDEGPYGNAWYVPGYGKQGNVRLGGTFNVTIEL